MNAAAARDGEWIALAHAVRARALSGEVVFRGDDEALALVVAGRTFGFRPAERERRELTVVAVREASGDLGVRFDGVDSREEAELLVGGILEARSRDLPRPTPEWFLWGHAEGLTAVTPEGTRLGTVSERVRSPAQTVFVIRDGGKEILLPAVPAFLREFRLDEGRLVVAPPEGLVELNDRPGKARTR